VVTQLEAFSHAISHDLRSPIGTVLNSVVILEEDYGDKLGEEGMRALRRIQSASESAARLLDQLALYAWSGPRDLERDVVDMTARAREAYAEVASSGYEIGEVEFVLHELPPAVGSAALIVRVFRNLLSNAVKYTRDRADRRIEVRAIPGRAENTYIVSDNGVGFDPAESESVFEPFHRLASSRGFEGSGVGLAVVAKIIRRHGGRVWAESDGLSGARFGFSLRSTEPRL
jgi:signal transduction histidine kinase